MTKIAVIEEKTSLPSSNVDLFLSKIIAQKDKNIDFVVAPEYAFSYSFDPMTESRKNDLLYK